VTFAVVQRDALGILAQAHQAEAEVCLEALLLEVEGDERSADQMRQHAAAERIHDRGPHHVAGNRDVVPSDGEGERTGDRPQDADERHECHDRGQQSKRQRERVRGDETQIFGDALVGVVRPEVLELQAVVHLLVHPRPDVAVRQPHAPAHLEHLAEVEPVDRGDDEEGGEDGEPYEQRRELRIVPLLQRVVE
jgi:hypothetical protein